MSKVRDLPEISVLTDDDLFYVIDNSAGPNGGRKITRINLKNALSLSALEVKTLYESNPDTNDFTDAEKAKLATVGMNAAFQNAVDVPYDNSTSGLAASNVQVAIDLVNDKAQADFRPAIVANRILSYSGGTARFDGSFYSILGSDILLNANVTDGYVYVDLDGTVKQTGSGVLPPPYTIVFAKFSTDTNNIIGLEDQRVKNSQNLIRGLLSDIDNIEAGDTAYEGDSGRVADAAHRHAVLTATAVSLAPSSTDQEGTGSALARADHSHLIATALVADITSLSVGDSSAAGTSDNYARGNHKHAVPRGTPVSIGASNAQGSATTFAGSDHVHQGLHSIHSNAGAQRFGDVSLQNGTGILITDDGSGNFTFAASEGLVGDIVTLNATNATAAGATGRLADAGHIHAISTGVVSTQNADQVNAAGSSANLARADHIHNIPTAIVLSIGSANAQGSLTTLAKSDHVHQGLHSINANGGSQRFGDVSLKSGVGVTITDDGSGNFTHETVIGPNELYVTQGTGLVANYTGGRVRINGTTYNIAASALTVALSATNGRIYVDVDGVVKSTTSTSSPPNTVPLAIFSSSGSAITALSDHRSLLNVNLTFGLNTDIATLNATNAAAAGSTNKYADAGHIHAISTGAASTITPDQANAAGTSANLIRADHVHNIPTAAAVSISTSTTNTQGAAATFANSAHTHAVSITNSQVTASSASALTTTAATDTLITGMTQTLAAGTYLVIWTSSCANSANGAERTFISAYYNGAQITNSEISVGTSGGAYSPVTVQGLFTSNGSNAVEIRARVAGGTTTYRAMTMQFIKLS